MPYQTDGVSPGHRDVDVRWSAMQTHLPESPFTSLDVGCAEGWFTSKLAEHGDAVGIDSDPSRFHHAASIVTATADATMLAKFLPVDVVLLLSILHHMPDGLDVFNLCRRQADVVFVELPHPDEKGVAKRCRDLQVIRDTVELMGEAIATTPGYDRSYGRTLWKL